VSVCGWVYVCMCVSVCMSVCVCVCEIASSENIKQMCCLLTDILTLFHLTLYTAKIMGLIFINI